MLRWVLVQSNCGAREQPGIKEDRGAIVIVVPTDAPLLAHQLNRLARRASLGLARAVEEAITNVLFAADTMTGNQGHTVEGLPVGRVLQILKSRSLADLCSTL